MFEGQRALDLLSLSAAPDKPSSMQHARLVNNDIVQQICLAQLLFPTKLLNLEVLLISQESFALSLLSEYQESIVRKSSRRPEVDPKMPMLGEKTLARLVEISAEEGVAVLEIVDTGDVFLVEKSEDEFIVWQVRR